MNAYECDDQDDDNENNDGDDADKDDCDDYITMMTADDHEHDDEDAA